MLNIRRCSAKRAGEGGFSLAELAVVLVVIGLILTAILTTTGLIGTSRSQAVQAAVTDFAQAISQFRAKYSYLPGDMPTAVGSIPDVVAGTCSATANGNGDGQIDAGEVACVTMHLFRAGFIKGGTGAIVLSMPHGNVTIRAIARSASAVTGFPTSTRNVIEVINAPCQIAQDLDSKMDDGNFAAGNIRATVASCTVNVANDPVPTIAVGF